MTLTLAAARAQVYNEIFALGATYSFFICDALGSKDEAGEFRWRWKAANGAIICTGGEGYVKEADCEHGLESFRKSAPDAEVRTLVDA